MARRLGILGIVLLLVLLVMSVAAAKPKGTDRPFKGTVAGEAIFDLDNSKGCPGDPVGFGITTMTDAEGNASHMGRVAMEAAHCPLLNGDLDAGVMVIVAANGDELHADYFGTATPIPPNIGDLIYTTTYLTFDPAASTGRFAGATGTAVFSAEVEFQGFGDVTWPISGSWTGTLS
jgi:hypothetical protein